MALSLNLLLLIADTKCTGVEKYAEKQILVKAHLLDVRLICPAYVSGCYMQKVFVAV